MRQAVRACVESVALYGSEVWFYGHTRPAYGRAGTWVPLGKSGLINEISSCLRVALLSILPVYRTAPTDALYREAGIPHPDQLLEMARDRFALRLGSLDAAYPLVARLAPLKNARSARRHERTNLARIAASLPSFPRPSLVPRRFTGASHLAVVDRSKADAAEDYLLWLESAPRSDLIVYSDGSKQEDGAVGWGFAVYYGGLIVYQSYGRLGPVEVFDAEATGAARALEAACRIA